jgi:hypothetical protein
MAIDLNNSDTYSVTDFGGGNLLYRDTSSGQYYDPSDLSSPLSSTDVAQYGSPTSTPLGAQVGLAGAGAQSGPLSLTTPSSGSGNVGGISTAIGSLFSGISSVISSENTSKTNLRLGASGLSPTSSLFGNPILLIGLGLLAFLAFRASK